MEGSYRVTQVHRDRYQVKNGTEELYCVLTGSLRYREEYPVAGDFVEITVNPYGDSLIRSILPRRTAFFRPDRGGHADGFAKNLQIQPLVANIDYVFIITSLNHDFSLNRIARYASMATAGGAVPVAVLTKADQCPNVEEMEKKARLIRSHGMSTMSYQRASGHATEYDITCLGYNFRMDDIRAAIAIEQLKKLPGDLKTRIKVRKHYIERLSKIEGVVVPFADNTEFVSNYILPTVLLNSTKERRNKIREYIHEAGVQTSVHYPAAHRFSTYKELGAVLPQTEYVTDNEITLPMYAALTVEQVDFICDVYEKAIKEIK